jgi:hypothetical protein
VRFRARSPRSRPRLQLSSPCWAERLA